LWLSLMLLALAAAGAAAACLRHDVRASRIESARRDAKALARTSATLFDQYLRGLDMLASSLVRNPSVAGLNRPECDRLFNALLREHPLLLNILLTTADETIRGSGLPTTHAKPQVSLPFIRQVLTGGKPAVGDLAVGPLTHKPAVMLGYPVRSDAAVEGVLAFGLDLSRLQSAFDAKPSEPDAIVLLTNSSGLVLARSREADRYIGTTVDLSGGSSQGLQEFASTQFDADGVERMVATVEVTGRRWMISAAVLPDAVAVVIWPFGWPTILLIAAAALLFVILALRLSSERSRGLAALHEMAQAAVRGEPPRVPDDGGGNSELAPVRESIAMLSDVLRQTRAELESQAEKEREAREMLETLQRHIVRQERLAAVGLLLSAVAHELNNPLQAIMGAAELLERRPDLLPDVQHEVALISTQAQRAAEIIRNLSRFGTPRAALPSIIDFADVISEVVELRRTDLDAAGITCEVRHESAGKVFASFTEIEQVLLNFVINAEQSIRQSAGAGGRILIRTCDAGMLVRVEVCDNGPGVRPEDEANIFEPFFTTKPLGQGTGLGLSVSRRIIESYGGTVAYRRNDSGGATFSFELPRLNE
jgi:C4-dicarboxylate-specific signal transduction histidine kinase